MFEGRSAGAAQFVVSILGVWASWTVRASRAKWVRTYALCSFAWAFFDSCYLLLLVVSRSERVEKWLSNFVASNTSPDLFDPIDKLLTALRPNATFAIIFVVSTGVLFSTLSAYWATVLYDDCFALAVITIVSAAHAPSSSSERAPLLRGNGSRQPANEQPRWTPVNARPASSLNPFSGRGHRLGDN